MGRLHVEFGPDDFAYIDVEEYVIPRGMAIVCRTPSGDQVVVRAGPGHQVAVEGVERVMNRREVDLALLQGIEDEEVPRG